MLCKYLILLEKLIWPTDICICGISYSKLIGKAETHKTAYFV